MVAGPVCLVTKNLFATVLNARPEKFPSGKSNNISDGSTSKEMSSR